MLEDSAMNGLCCCDEKWLRLPRGVRFQPTDEDIIWHLLAEIGEGDVKPHPFICEFIKSWNINDSLSYFSPHQLPGVRKDGNMAYFFHKPFMSQEIRSRKDRGVNDGCSTDFWRKFGRTKPIYVDGTQKGSKQIFVLCKDLQEHAKFRRTNWVMHQYHIGTGEDVEGDLAISKIFYQLESKQNIKDAHNHHVNSAETVANFATNGFLDHNFIVRTRHDEANASQRNASQVMDGPSNFIQKNTMENADSIPSAVSGSENDEIDHVTLQERYLLLLSKINYNVNRSKNDKVNHETFQGQYKLMLPVMNTDSGHHCISEISQDIGFGVPMERNEAQMGDMQKSCESISAMLSSSSLPNIDCIKEISASMVKDEVTDDQFLHDDTLSMKSSVGHHVLLVPCCIKVSPGTGHEEYHDQDTAQVKSMSIEENVIYTKTQEKDQFYDIFDYANMNISASTLGDTCPSQDTCPDASSPGAIGVHHLLKCNGSRQPSNITLCIKTEPLDECNLNSIPEKNAHEPFNILPEIDANVQSEVRNSGLPNYSIKPKLEPMEVNVFVSCENKIEKHVMEVKSDDELNFLDDIPLSERMQMLTSANMANMACDVNVLSPRRTMLPPGYDAPNETDAKTRNSSINRKRKKTATDSVEVALEEDAPGLLKMLLENGITAEEIKLYGEEESDEAISICSTDESFQNFEAILAKLFPEVPSMLKLPPLRKVKASKVHYCVACLLSLIEQAQYLRFRKSPVEWGWCRDLQSFIFVFESHNRLVLERPEYGYATYFFELVESLPVDWQIKRLVTAMKLPCCSRTALLENRPLTVGEDMSDGEARVMEEFGWIRNTGLGTMLRYCDRVSHDRKNEKYSSEWNAKIGKLLMDGRDSGRIVLHNMPKRFKQENENEGLEVKQEPYL